MVKEKETPKMSKEEEIGYHKGALNTLANERNEFLRLINIVDTFIKGHLKRLEELGIKINRKE
ncbi:MAG: hypothetical protein ABIH59_02175 [archaeon]